MDHYKPRLYLTSAFIAGILLTLGFKDFYPDLERRFRQARTARLAKAKGRKSSSSSSSSSSSTSAGAGICDASENKNENITLEDHTITSGGGGGVAGGWDDKVISDVRDGIEACVGNTPLFRIKSLSEETGCEIFAKAEVWKNHDNIPNILEGVEDLLPATTFSDLV